MNVIAFEIKSISFPRKRSVTGCWNSWNCRVIEHYLTVEYEACEEFTVHVILGKCIRRRVK